MKEARFSKFFPKEFRHSTTIDEDGYLVYKRRDDGFFIEKNGHILVMEMWCLIVLFS